MSNSAMVGDNNFKVPLSGDDVIFDALDDLPDLTHFFRLDVIGIKERPEENNDITYEEQRAEELIKTNTKFNEETRQYETALPWKSHKIEETNAERALATAHAFVKKYQQKDPEVIEGWIRACQEMLDFGFIEKVPMKDLKKKKDFHYIQTFPVWSPKSSTHRCRIVFQANQLDPETKKSLNSHLLTGKNNIPEIPQLLINFRTHVIAGVTDVSKMFNRFLLHENEKDYLRFFSHSKDLSPKMERFP